MAEGRQTGGAHTGPARARQRLQQRRFERLLNRLTRQDRRIVAALLSRLAELEARGEQQQAMRLIDQVENILKAPDHDA